MRIRTKLPARDCKTIVQQMNCYTTKQMFLDFFAGRQVSLPPGSDQRSFDCEDQTNVDWNAPSIQEAENLIEQHFERENYIKHLHPDPAPADPAPVVDPAPVADPASSPVVDS